MTEPFQFRIYPWIHSLSNSEKVEDQLAHVDIPDVLPGNISPKTNFSMVAGDFIEVYSAPNYNGIINNQLLKKKKKNSI